ncbi:MAG: hypothetical protein ACRD36_13215, partial [Candidatus Acidiferrum sp.]
YQGVTALIKGVYQLGHALRGAESNVLACLEPLTRRLKACDWAGTPIAQVEHVRPGAILDAKTMAPLNYGARVAVPLGLLLRDSNGKVLAKAKVLCA